MDFDHGNYLYFIDQRVEEKGKISSIENTFNLSIRIAKIILIRKWTVSGQSTSGSKAECTFIPNVVLRHNKWPI